MAHSTHAQPVPEPVITRKGPLSLSEIPMNAIILRALEHLNLNTTYNGILLCQQTVAGFQMPAYMPKSAEDDGFISRLLLRYNLAENMATDQSRFIISYDGVDQIGVVFKSSLEGLHAKVSGQPFMHLREGFFAKYQPLEKVRKHFLDIDMALHNNVQSTALRLSRIFLGDNTVLSSSQQ